MKKTRQKAAFYIGQKAVYFNFKEENTSSDGGLLLIHKLEKKRGYIQQISLVIQDTRSGYWIHHSIPKLFGQRVYPLMLGYPDGHNVERLRRDAIFKLLLGKLASQPTRYRFENNMKGLEIWGLYWQMVTVYAEKTSSLHH